MKAEVLRKKSGDELQTELNILLKEQFSLRIQKGLQESIKPHLIKNARRNIARVKTILNQKAHENE